ncbi:MAG TPA: hypothetical protein PLN69_12550 [bacterium]|nr:hypothetical protein [bacterium]
MKNKLFLLIIAAVFSTLTAEAETDVLGLMLNLHRFDISCKMFDTENGKKVCGVRHADEFSELMKVEDKAAALAIVEDLQKKSKERLAKLEEMKGSLPEADADEAARLSEVALRAQQGDEKAVEELFKAGYAAIPAILDIGNEREVLPAPEVQKILSEIETLADAAIMYEGGNGLNRDVMQRLIEREESYGAILKRAVIGLEGTRRAFPYWLPFVYMYGLGFIPFFAGIIASVIYYRRIRLDVIALVMGSYLFYFCLHGYFQFIAPWSN